MTTDDRIAAMVALGLEVIEADRGHDWRVMVLRGDGVPAVHYARTRDEAVASAYEAATRGPA